MIPTCTLDDRSILELASAHELIEAATDAYPLTNPAYQMPKSISWYAFALACDAVGNPVSFDTTVSPATLNNGGSGTLTISVPGHELHVRRRCFSSRGTDDWGLWSVGIQVP